MAKEEETVVKTDSVELGDVCESPVVAVLSLVEAEDDEGSPLVISALVSVLKVEVEKVLALVVTDDVCEVVVAVVLFVVEVITDSALVVISFCEEKVEEVSTLDVFDELKVVLD